jgi:dienelactone hydrolase
MISAAMKTLSLLALAGLMALPLAAQRSPVAGKNTITLRGREQEVYFYPAPGSSGSKGKVLYLPGDLGLTGMGGAVARTIASWGYDVYALDTRSYLSSFTGSVSLKEAEVMDDVLRVGNWIAGGANEKVPLVGWSEGAGLCLLAAVPPDGKSRFSGVIVFGLTEFPTLAWHWTNLFADMMGRAPNEPTFSSAAYLPKVAPLPLLLIQSSNDQFVPVSTAQRLFTLAADPKRFQLIDAKNHRFEGNQDRLYQTIREGLEWIRNPSQ